jgi:hypothetical protein
MYRTDATDNTAIKPAKTPIGTAGFYQDSLPGQGTIVDAEHMNTMMDELAALVENAGLTLDKANDAQAWDAIGGGAAAKSDAASTGSVTTNHTRAVVASTTSLASGGSSAVLASQAAEVTSPRSTVIASVNTNVDGGSPLYDCSATIAYDASVAGFVPTNQGKASAIIGCKSTSGGEVTVSTDAVACVALASGSGLVQMALGASSSYNAAIACTGGTVAGSTASAIIASGADSVSALARPRLDACEFSTFISCDGDADVTADNVVVLASSFGAGPGPTLADPNTVNLYDGSGNLTVKMKAGTGKLECGDIEPNNATQAPGGGAAATLATVGGLGPAGAGQVQWLQLQIGPPGGVKTQYFIPLWQ